MCCLYSHLVSNVHVDLFMGNFACYLCQKRRLEMMFRDLESGRDSYQVQSRKVVENAYNYRCKALWQVLVLRFPVATFSRK